MSHASFKLAYSIPEGANAIGFSTRKFYSEIAQGRILTFKVGKRRFVSEDALRKYIAERERETR